MNLLIGLVITTFIITGAYVGYHVSLEQSQETDEIKGHSSTIIELETLSNDAYLMYIPYGSVGLTGVDQKLYS